MQLKGDLSFWPTSSKNNNNIGWILGCRNRADSATTIDLINHALLKGERDLYPHLRESHKQCAKALFPDLGSRDLSTRAEYGRKERGSSRNGVLAQSSFLIQASILCQTDILNQAYFSLVEKLLKLESLLKRSLFLVALVAKEEGFLSVLAISVGCTNFPTSQLPLLLCNSCLA